VTGPETALQFDKACGHGGVPPWSNRRRAGLAAVLLSLVIHASGITVAFLLWARPGGGSGPALLILDTRVHAAPEVSIVLAEPGPRRAARPLTNPAMKPAPPMEVAIARASEKKTGSPPSSISPRPLPPALGPLLVSRAPPASPGPPGGQTEEQQSSSWLRRAPTNGPATGQTNGSESGHGVPAASGKSSFFQIETDARSIVYVIDCSASMGQDDGLLRAKAELLASLNQLPAATLFQVIPYNSRAEPLCINGRLDLVPANAENKRAAALLIADLQAVGATRHLQALHQALALRPEVIFFLTDGDDLAAAEIAALTRFNGGKTIVHTIGLRVAGQAVPPGSLQILAQVNHGSFRIVGTSASR
jgi:hypothetical protein